MTRRDNQKRQLSKLPVEDMRLMIETIFDNTANGIKDCNMKDLTQTTISMAKIVQILKKRAGGRRGEDAYRMILRELFLNKDSRTANKELFRFIAEESMDILHKSEARQISNLAYAYALIEYVPKFDDGSDLFDHIAMYSTEMRAELNAQDVSNMVWAYATVKKRHDALFEAMGDQIAGLKSLDRFTHPQDVSNTVWAYATAGVSHPHLFEKMANHIFRLDHLSKFKPQELSNTAWAYATAGVSDPNLFEKIADHIARLDHLRYFIPQHLSNTVWAYATAGVNHPQLFEKLANHIVQLDHLREFKPQELSNTVWAYAAAGVNHPQLFEKMANHIVQLDHLRHFKPQALSNIVWAYATAGVNHPQFFEKVAKHIVRLDHLREFNAQDLSNTAWAYATAQVSHPKMFQQVANAAIQREEDFIPQHVANLLWSYATMGIYDKQLFSSFVPIAAKLMDKYNNQNLANIAWAYAIADVDAPTLFNDRFINKCLEKKDGFSIENICQLHQWHLWQTKEKSRNGLPEELQDRCYKEFISEEPTRSKLQDDVVEQLSSIGLNPKEEALMDSGYRIDALVEVNGKTIGVEVDGPFHFIGRSKAPLARTILKRRQVPSIDGLELVSVPYWVWNQLGKNQAKKQEYLHRLLGLDTVLDD
jgi:GTPase Era involved in 16S rRNA processing